MDNVTKFYDEYFRGWDFNEAIKPAYVKHIITVFKKTAKELEEHVIQIPEGGYELYKHVFNEIDETNANLKMKKIIAWLDEHQIKKGDLFKKMSIIVQSLEDERIRVKQQITYEKKRFFEAVPAHLLKDVSDSHAYFRKNHKMSLPKVKRSTSQASSDSVKRKMDQLQKWASLTIE